MLLNKKILRLIVKKHLLEQSLNVIEEGRRQREQLYNKFPGLQIIYKWWKDQWEGKVPGKIDDNELRWIAKREDVISSQLTKNLNLKNEDNKPPISPTTINQILEIILDFVNNKQSVGKLHQKYKNKLSPQELKEYGILGADIFAYESILDVKKACSHFESKEDIISSFVDNPKDLSQLVSLGNFGNYEIVVPQTKKASISFDSTPTHKTTTWCTTRRSGQNLFDNYTQDGGILFYLKNTDADDKEASKKDGNTYKYINPYDRWCIGINSQNSNINWPSQGSGYGGLIVDQNNQGVWEEKAKEILGASYDNAIESIQKYYKEKNGKLPYAKAFSGIVKSLSAVKDTISDYTWPEQYQFLVSQNNKSSILNLSKKTLPNQPKPSMLVVAYANNFKKDMEKDISKIMKATAGEKAAKYCFYGIKQFKRQEICVKIINEKLVTDPIETHLEFLKLIFNNPSIAYIAENGLPQEIYASYFRSQDSTTSQTFNEWQTNISPNLENILVNFKTKVDQLNACQCQHTKKHLQDHAETRHGKKLFRNFALNVENITTETFDEETLKTILADSNLLSNTPGLNLGKKIKKLIKENVPELIRAEIKLMCQRIDIEYLVSLINLDSTDSILKVYESIIKNIYSSLDADSIAILNTSISEYSKKGIAEAVIYDICKDLDASNNEKFGILLQNISIEKLKKLCGGDDNFISSLTAKCVVEAEYGTSTTLQKYVASTAGSVLVFRNVLRGYLIKCKEKNITISQSAVFGSMVTSDNEASFKSINAVTKNSNALSNLTTAEDILKIIGAIFLKTPIPVTDAKKSSFSFNGHRRQQTLERIIAHADTDNLVSREQIFQFLDEKNIDYLQGYEKIYGGTDTNARLYETILDHFKIEDANNLNLLESIVKYFIKFHKNIKNIKNGYSSFAHTVYSIVSTGSRPNLDLSNLDSILGMLNNDISAYYILPPMAYTKSNFSYEASEKIWAKTLSAEKLNTPGSYGSPVGDDRIDYMLGYIAKNQNPNALEFVKILNTFRKINIDVFNYVFNKLKAANMSRELIDAIEQGLGLAQTPEIEQDKESVPLPTEADDSSTEKEKEEKEQPSSPEIEKEKENIGK